MNLKSFFKKMLTKIKKEKSDNSMFGRTTIG
mgnify:CR=1 FL=1